MDGKPVRVIIALTAGAAAVYLAGVLLFGGAAWITAPFRGELGEREDTTGSADFRRSTYEEFFDLCTAAQDDEGSIRALQQERRTAGATRRARIDESITALRSSRTEAINGYNAKAAQEIRAPFRDRRLPYRLDVRAARTTCAEPAPKGGTP